MREKDNDNKLTDTKEAEELYEIYKRVQSGDKDAMNELFQSKQSKRHITPYFDERYRKRRRKNMDNVLDSAFIVDDEKQNDQQRREEEWINSDNSDVEFRFSILNKMLTNKKKTLMKEWKNTGYENGEKTEYDTCVKFYGGKYDVTDFNNLMYQTVLEIFNEKTDEECCITLDGKRNSKCPICDGVSLLKNISYFVVKRVNSRAGKCYLDTCGTAYCEDEEDSEAENLLFDKCSFRKFLEDVDNIEVESCTSKRLPLYAECLKWIQRNDVCKLFKSTSCDVQAIIKTIMNCKETFKVGEVGDKDIGFGMRFVTQEVLRELIQDRYNLNIGQENISRNLKYIEQRLLDFLFYSLNYEVCKAKESIGIFEKESERVLCELEEKSYIKMFGKASHEIYKESTRFLSGGDYDSYLETVEMYEDMVMDAISLEKWKKKYNMANLILKNEDLIDDKKETLKNIAKTMTAYYQEQEAEYVNNELNQYERKGFENWTSSYWEAELKKDILKIRLWSSKNIKKPIRHNIDKDRLIVYCGYVNFYFCDTEEKICYRLPKDKRIISRSNKNQEVSIYNVK